MRTLVFGRKRLVAAHDVARAQLFAVKALARPDLVGTGCDRTTSRGAVSKRRSDVVFPGLAS